MSSIHDFVSQAQTFFTSLQSEFSTQMESGVNRDWVQYQALVLHSNWSGLSSKSQETLSNLQSTNAFFHTKQQEFNDIFSQFLSLENELKQAVADLPDDFQQGVRDEITGIGTSGGMTSDMHSVVDWLDSGSKFYRQQLKVFNFYIHLFDDYYEAMLSTFAYNLYAKYVASFNQGEGGSSSANPDNTYYYYTSTLEQKLAQVKDLLSQDSNDQASELTAVEEWIDDVIDSKILPTLNTLHDSRGTDLVLHKQYLKISELLRVFVTYKVGLMWITWKYSWDTRSKSYQKFVANIGDLSVDIIGLPGTEVDIQSLVSTPTDYNHQEVIIEGMIESVTNTEIDDRNMSVIIVNDSEGNSMKSAIPYFHLDTQGVKIGGYCRLSGLFQVANDYLEGSPGIKIRRHSLGSMDDSSFNAWIRANIASMFQLNPHNLHVSCSFEKGSDGAAAPIQFNVVSKEDVNPFRKTYKTL